jgi:protein TonB
VSSLTVVGKQASQESSGPPATSQQEQSSQPAPERVRVSLGVSQGLLIKKVAPKYPEKARRDHIQGKVMLLAEISPEEQARNLTLISGDPSLAKAAIKAVKQWKYKPYLLMGKPVAVETQIQVNFTLSE